MKNSKYILTTAVALTAIMILTNCSNPNKSNKITKVKTDKKLKITINILYLLIYIIL